MDAKHVSTRREYARSERGLEADVADALAVEILEDVVLDTHQAGALFDFGLGFGQLHLELSNSELKGGSIGCILSGWIGFESGGERSRAWMRVDLRVIRASSSSFAR